VVLITDGYIGNDNEVIAAVQKNLKPGNRLYSFGVGSSVNRYLLDRVAEMGRGTSRVVRQDEPTQAVAEKFFRQINNPVLTNIQVKWEGDGAAPEIYPSNAPDLFAEQPLVLFGKKGDHANGKLKITGIAAGGERFEQTLDVNFEANSDSRNSNLGIAQLWGRARIKDLMNRMFGGEVKSLVDAVTQTALNYRLLSQYTAFVAVSEEVRVNPDGGKVTVQVPVLLPEGVNFGAVTDGIQEQAAKSAPSSVMASPPAPTYNAAPNNAPMRSRGLIGNGAVAESSKDVDSTIRSEPKVIGRLDSGSLTDKTENLPVPNSQVPNSQVQVVSITGLTGVDLVTAQQAIAKQLSSLKVPAGLNGTVILEIPIQNGRLLKFLLDDVASTLQDKNLVEMLKRSLQNVTLLSAAKGTIRLTLNVRS
jgi:Ca-activated chloride channel family protein